MSDYIEKIIRDSEEIDNFNTIEKEFIHVLNEAVLSDNLDKKFELVYHSKLSGCYGETGDYPVIYRVVFVSERTFKNWFSCVSLDKKYQDIVLKKHFVIF